MTAARENGVAVAADASKRRQWYESDAVKTLRLLPFLIALTGCPAPEPAKAPATAEPDEGQAKSALESAKKGGDPDELIAVFNKYPKFASGKKALRLGVRLEQ